MEGDRKQAIHSLTLTVLLGFYFTFLQGLEYYEAPFTIADGVYGSTFFVATGFHGLHVIIGSTFLAVCLLRQIQYSRVLSLYFPLLRRAGQYLIYLTCTLQTSPLLFQCLF